MQLISSLDEALTTRAEEVPQGEDVIAFVRGMFELMYQKRGVGLAANQVGVLKRIIVFHVGSTKQAIINPVIVKTHPRTCRSVEGCLSYPGKRVSMLRYKTITVKGFDENWLPVKISGSSMVAFCIQHEIDHLDGKTIAHP